MTLFLLNATLLAATAWIILGTGVLLALWAFLWDRPRGRRRCPSCWYDMAGVPGLKCPECGRDAKREERLTKTRRRWRWAAIAALLLLVGLAAPRVQDVREHGWPAAVPTTAVLLSLAWLDAPNQAEQYAAKWEDDPLPARKRLYHDLFERRLRGHRLAGWQRRWLIERLAHGDRRRPIGSRAWRVSYGSTLQMMHAGIERARAGEAQDPNAASVAPWFFPGTYVLDAPDDELRRIREGLARGSIRVRQEWPVELPFMVEVHPLFADPMPRRDLSARRELTVQAQLPGSRPITIEFGRGQRVIHQDWHLDPHGGQAASPQRGLDFDVRLVDGRWDGVMVHEELLLDTTIRHPIRFRPMREIMRPRECDRIAAALAAAIDPLCSPGTWHEGRIVANLFKPHTTTANELVASLAAHPDLTLGLRIELVALSRGGEVVAEGLAWWQADPGRGGVQPGLGGQGHAVATLYLRAQNLAPPGTGEQWLLRITGDPAAAVMNFDSSVYWHGALEAPVQWTPYAQRR